MHARSIVWLALATVLCNAAAFAQPTTQRPAGPGQRQPSAPSPTTPGGQRGQQRPPRDTADAPAGTAVISGRVTEADSGRPIRRAIVQVLGRSIGRDSRVTATDDDGAFVVRELPAGDFIVSARKPGYVSATFGAAGSAPAPGMPGGGPMGGGGAFDTGDTIKLSDRQAFDRADIALQRGGVITGRVIDEFGDPVLDARVSILRRRWVRGKPQLVSAGANTQTNDIGEYRAYGLAPGDYYVSATMSGEFSRAVSTAESGYAPSFHPGTPDVNGAQAIRVAPGMQSQADIALQPVRLGRVLGVLLDGSGRPASSGRVMGRRLDEDVQAMFDNRVQASVKSDGTFTVPGLAPGRYLLQGGEGGGRFGMGPGAGEIADGTVDVISGEVSTVTLAVTPGGTVRGRVIVDGTPVESLTSISVAITPLDPGMFMGGRPTQVSADGAFEIANVRGTVQFRIAGGQGVTMKSVKYGGSDVTAEGVPVQSGRTTSGIEIHVTKDVASITGAVTDSRGQPIKGAVVVVFNQDPAQWFSPAGRGIAVGRPDQDGRYTVGGLLAGEYCAVALTDFDSSVQGDPDVMERLRSMATEFRLGDGETRGLDLKLQQ